VNFARCQGIPKCRGVHCRDAHALPIDRIETADGIARDDKTLWEPTQFVVAPPPARRSVKACWFTHRLGAAQRRNDMWRGDFGDVVDHSIHLRWRLMATDAGRSHIHKSFS
jgi:hypothetical protein